ncbi:MAG: DUF6457 domain-containing protein [Acidimicrobiales bacterium]
MTEPAEEEALAAAWLAGFAERLGVATPTAEEFEDLLALAAVAAHASHRTAAPVACWLAARAGVSPGEATTVARELGPAAED